MKPQNKKEGWEEHIDLDLYRLGYPKEEIGEIISIYRSLLHEREEEMVKAVEGLKRQAIVRYVPITSMSNEERDNHFWNLALDEVINKVILRK